MVTIFAILALVCAGMSGLASWQWHRTTDPKRKTAMIALMMGLAVLSVVCGVTALSSTTTTVTQVQ